MRPMLPPFMTVVIAYFNASKHLDSIEAVLTAQRESLRKAVVQCTSHAGDAEFTSDIEVIIVDDCSSDAEKVALLSRAEGHNWQVVELAQNGGPGVARNEGISKATGKYLLFMDADDALAPHACGALYREYLQAQAALAGEPADVICFDYTMISPRVTLSYSTIPQAQAGVVDVRQALATVRGSTFGKCYLRSLITRHNLQFGTLRRHEDTAFTKSAVCWAERIWYTKESLYEYRMTPGSLTHDTQLESFETSFDALRIIKASTQGRHQLEVQYVYIVEVIMSCAMKFYLLDISADEAREFYDRIDREEPGWWYNPYLSQASARYRLIAWLVRKRQTRLIKAMMWCDKLARAALRIT